MEMKSTPKGVLFCVFAGDGVLIPENEGPLSRRSSNEIVPHTMKSSRCSDEICCADERKTVPLPTKSDFITK